MGSEDRQPLLRSKPLADSRTPPLKPPGWPRRLVPTDGAPGTRDRKQSRCRRGRHGDRCQIGTPARGRHQAWARWPPLKRFRNCRHQTLCPRLDVSSAPHGRWQIPGFTQDKPAGWTSGGAGRTQPPHAPSLSGGASGQPPPPAVRTRPPVPPHAQEVDPLSTKDPWPETGRRLCPDAPSALALGPPPGRWRCDWGRWPWRSWPGPR